MSGYHLKGLAQCATWYESKLSQFFGLFPRHTLLSPRQLEDVKVRTGTWAAKVQ